MATDIFMSAHYSNTRRPFIDLFRRPCPTCRVLLSVGAGRANHEHPICLQTADDGGRVSEGSDSSSRKGEGRLGDIA